MTLFAGSGTSRRLGPSTESGNMIFGFSLSNDQKSHDAPRFGNGVLLHRTV